MYKNLRVTWCPPIWHFQGRLETQRLHLSHHLRPSSLWLGLLAYKVYRPRTVFHGTQGDSLSLWITAEGFGLLIGFWAPLLRPCKIAAWYLSRWPLPSSVLQSQLGLSSRVASSAHRCRFAVPPGAISLNHFLASGSCIFPRCWKGRLVVGLCHPM